MIVRFGKIRAQPDGMLVIRNRGRMISHGLVAIRKRHPGTWVRAVALKGPVDGVETLGGIGALESDGPEQTPRFPVVRVARHDLASDLLGARELARREMPRGKRKQLRVGDHPAFLSSKNRQ